MEENDKEKILELERRIHTLTSALEEKAEENLTYSDEMMKLQARVNQLEEVEREHKRDAQLLAEYERRITTLSICLDDLAQSNARLLSDAVERREAEQRAAAAAAKAESAAASDSSSGVRVGSGLKKLFNLGGEAKRLKKAQLIGRNAKVGLMHVNEGTTLDEVGSSQEAPDSAATRAGDGNAAAMGGNGDDDGDDDVDQQSVAAEPSFAELRIKLAKKKSKIVYLKEQLASQTDRANAAEESIRKYDKELTRALREHRQNIKREAERREVADRELKMKGERIMQLETQLSEESSGE